MVLLILDVVLFILDVVLLILDEVLLISAFVSYFLALLTKLRIATISFVMSVCPSVRPFASLSIRMEQLCSPERIFVKFDI